MRPVRQLNMQLMVRVAKHRLLPRGRKPTGPLLRLKLPPHQRPPLRTTHSGQPLNFQHLDQPQEQSLELLLDQWSTLPLPRPHHKVGEPSLQLTAPHWPPPLHGLLATAWQPQ